MRDTNPPPRPATTAPDGRSAPKEASAMTEAITRSTWGADHAYYVAHDGTRVYVSNGRSLYAWRGSKQRRAIERVRLDVMARHGEDGDDHQSTVRP